MLTVAGNQVEPTEKRKTPKGRAHKRITYTRRFVNVTMTGGKRKVQLFCSLILERLAKAVGADEPEPNLIGQTETPKDVGCGKHMGQRGITVVAAIT